MNTDSSTPSFLAKDYRHENKEDSFAVESKKNFSIQIKANPTTGYQVFLKSSVSELESSGVVTPLNLKPEGTTGDYNTDPHEEGMTGVGGSYFFKFSANKPGEVLLVFENKRVWDPSDATQSNIKIVVS